MENTGTLTAPALACLLLALLAIFGLSRRAVMLPVLVATVLMTIGQQIQIGALHFYFLRIVILVAWLRVLVRKETADLALNPVDKAFLCWVVFSIVIGFVPKAVNPNAVMPPPTFTSVLINRGGFALDALGAYFLARCLIRDPKDVMYAIRVMVLISIVLACFMTFEKLTRHNLFSVFGAVPEVTVERDGRFRCQGPFTHPIHAGNYGATLMPLCIGLWFFGWKRFAVAGFIGASMVTIESASSGPLMAWIYGMAAFCFWPLRGRMRQVRWVLLLMTLGLHLVMKAPVWWTISRVSDLVGGGGYWRSKLIDEFVNHFNEWWLAGTTYTAHWSPTGVGLPLYPDYMDLTNQFVVEGVSGGLLKLILFIVIIVKCFQRIGLAVQSTTTQYENEQFVFWALGCCLVAYMASFLSVAGSLQTDILFYTLLAFVGASPVSSEEPAAMAEAEREDLSTDAELSSVTH